MKRLFLPVGAVLCLGILVWIFRQPLAPVAPPPRVPEAPSIPETSQTPEPGASQPLVRNLPPEKPKPRIWPPVEQVLSDSQKKASIPATTALPLSTAPSAASEDAASPVAPPVTPEEMKRIASWKKEDLETPPRLRALLLDPERSPSVKLLALEKMRTLGADAAIPALVDFLKSEDPASDRSCLKPTAAGILAGFHSPQASAALGDVGSATKNEALRLTIISLQTKGRIP